MALNYPDILQHNNPNLAIADSNFIRGGTRTAVADLTALYALSSKVDQLKQYATKVYVTSEAKYYILVDISNVSNSTGWAIESGGGGAAVLDTVLTGFIPTQGVVTSSDTVLTGLEKIAANALDVSSTGVYIFGGLTLASTTTFNVGAAEGFIVDNTTVTANPSVIKVTYAGGTGLTDPNLTTSTETYVMLDNTGTLLLLPTFPTPQQRRQNIYLGKLGHPDKIVFLNAFSQPDLIQSPLSQLRDVWSPINLINGGVYPSPNGANLTFNTSAGTIYGLGINFSVNPLSPSAFSVAAQVPTTFRYRTQVGGSGGNITTIDPTSYDVAGVVTAISGVGGRATNQRIYCLQNGQIRIQYGQTIYSSLTDAIQGIQTEVFTVFPNYKDNAILIGILSLTKNATDLTDTARSRFLLVSKFGESIGAAGGVSTTTLQQAYDNSIIPNILTNATLGGISIKRGSTADTDNILYGQNGAGTTTFSITGNGDITANSFIKTGGLSTGFLKANGTVDSTTYQPTITGAATTITSSNLTVSRVLVSDASGKVSANAVTTTTLGYLDATSSIQTQLNGKASSLSGTINTLSYFDSATTIASLALATYPSLTEVSYVKGVTSAIQTQLNAKAAALAGTINTIAYFNSATTIASLALATYPSLAELAYVKGVTSAIQTQLNAKQALDATLTALAAYNTNGILTQTAADTFTGRTITGTTNQVIVTNGDGVAGNPTLSLPQNIHTAATPQFAGLGLGAAANVASYLNVIANTASVGQIYFPPSALDYTGTLSGMLWNNTSEWKFYDGVLSTVNRLVKLNGNTALVNSNPLNVVTSTGTGGNLGTLKAEVSFSRYPTAVSYTILLTDVGFGWVVAVTSTAAARTITLPLANTVPAGWYIVIKDESGAAGTNNITVAVSGSDTIQGSTTNVINGNYASRSLYSDGVSKWFYISYII